MNKVILVGRLARDPEVRYTQAGKAVASFSLAVSRRFSRASDQQNTADFIPIVAWEKLAEIVGNNLVKGSQILVEGRMQVRNYDAQDGSKRYVTEVVAQDIEFMGSKPQGVAQEPSGANSFGSEVLPDDDIPF
ncbi:MAG: single-stranded DNA-binding protein [Proteocatella sp.]